MRIFNKLLVLGVAGICFAQVPQPFSLKISALKPQIKVGEPVDIEVVMTNTSDHDVDCTVWSSNGVDKNYHYRVFDEHGNQLEERVRKFAPPSSTWPCTLKSGQTDSPSGGRISTLFDFSRPGEYSVHVERSVTSDPHGAVIQSNTITVTVLP